MEFPSHVPVAFSAAHFGAPRDLLTGPFRPALQRALPPTLVLPAGNWIHDKQLPLSREIAPFFEASPYNSEFIFWLPSAFVQIWLSSARSAKAENILQSVHGLIFLRNPRTFQFVGCMTEKVSKPGMSICFPLRWLQHVSGDTSGFLGIVPRLSVLCSEALTAILDDVA